MVRALGPRHRRAPAACCTGHPDGVWPVRFSPSGELVAAGGGDGVVRVWDTATGDCRTELPGHQAPIYTAAFGPGGDVLVTGDAAGMIRIWDLPTGRAGRTLTGTAAPSTGSPTAPTARVLATGDASGRGPDVGHRAPGGSGTS